MIYELLLIIGFPFLNMALCMLFSHILSADLVLIHNISHNRTANMF